MFNIYTYEKRQKQSEIENIKNLIYSKEYIKKRDKLAKKFYSKINNFLFDMAKKPIIIKNNYYISSQDKSNYSFQIRKFETDRERIEKLLSSQDNHQYISSPIGLKKKDKFNKSIIINDLVNINNNASQFINNNNNSNTSNNTELIYHPSDQTNHTPSDLEKILDTIYINQELEKKQNQSSIKLKEPNLKKRKVKKIESKKFEIKPPKLSRYMSNLNIRENKSPKQDEKNLEQKLFLYQKQQKKNKNLSKIRLNKTLRNSKHSEDDNSNYKTYFNSIQQAIIYKDIEKSGIKNSKDDINNSRALKNSASTLNVMNQKNNNFLLNGHEMNRVKDLLYKKINKKNTKKNNNELNNLSFMENKQKIIEKILKLNKPPKYGIKDHQKIRKKDLNIVRQLAIKEVKKNPQKKFLGYKFDELQDSKNAGFYSNYELSHIAGLHSKITSIKNKINKGEIIEDDNLILYNNCVYYKKDENDMKKLGKIILQKCHFVNNKYFNNENNKLQKGNGKLMITNGLSINEFIDKFALPNLRHKNMT